MGSPGLNGFKCLAVVEGGRGWGGARFSDLYPLCSIYLYDVTVFSPKFRSPLLPYSHNKPQGHDHCVTRILLKALVHRLNIGWSYLVDLQSLFGLHVHSCTHWLRPCDTPAPFRIWAHIRVRFWSAKIDDISVWPPAFCLKAFPCGISDS
jgi:hypothetical protein